jgi:hypothetical protein
MLCVQYLASAMRPSHPSHEVVQLPSGPRQMKLTLQSRYMPSLAPHLVNGIVPQVSYKRILNKIHMSTVASVKAKLVNRVLQGTPPPISASEMRLPKSGRRTLAQLRDDRCFRLKNYQVFIKKIADDSCPECGIASHSAPHLFCCMAYPTDLTFLNLWTKPVQAALFLATLPSFSHLAALDLSCPVSNAGNNYNTE